MRGARRRERLQARAVAALLAPELKGMTVVALADDEQHEAHADPRAHLEAADQLVNDADGQLAEAAELAARRAREEDDAWREQFGGAADFDVDKEN